MNIDVKNGNVNVYDEADKYRIEPLVYCPIEYINITCEEDRENLIGICRITSLDMSIGEVVNKDNNLLEYEISSVNRNAETYLFNQVASLESNSNNDDWKQEMIITVSQISGVSEEKIQVVQ